MIIDEKSNLATHSKISVCQNEKSSVEVHMTGGIWNDSDKEKDGLCPTV